MTFVLAVLAGFAVAGAERPGTVNLATVTSRSAVPWYVRTGAHFLPPVSCNHSPAAGPRAFASGPWGIDSFPSPDTTPFGLAYDGANLWNVDLFGQRIYALDPASGSVRRSFSAPDQWSKGLCWDGQYLWVTGNSGDRIYKVDTTSGSVVLSFNAPGVNPVGVAYDGTYLWNADVNADQSKPSHIFKLNPANGARLDSFEAPCRMVADMDLDGTRLWVADMDNSIAYGMDPSTGRVTRAAGTPGPRPTGIGFIGNRLANSDWGTKRIYTFHPDSGPAAITLEQPAQWDVLPTWRDPAVIGTVVGLGLDSFRVEYGQGEQPTQWTPAGPSRTSPAYRDTLAVWDVSGITEPGAYRVRIKAFFTGGIDSTHARTVGIDPEIASGWPKTFANVSPVACADIAGDEPLEVIAGTDHQDYFNNRLAAWTYEGLGVPGFPVPGICVCQMPAATGDVNVDGRAEIATGFDLNGNEVYLVRGSGAVMSGWPQDGGHPGSLNYLGIPVLARALRDSLLEVFSGGGRLSGWDTSGTALAGWPQSAEFSSPAAADLDHDGAPELIALRRDSAYVFRADGQIVDGWPVGFGGAGGSTFPVAGDLNHDDRVEIAFTIGARLFCIDDSGQALSGFPKTLPGNYANSPVLGDIDGDGLAEIVVVSGSFPSFSAISVYRPDGSSPSGWPKTLNGQVFRAFNAPVLGDVDGDGFPDVLMGLENVNQGFERLYAWDRHGNDIAGWPRLLRYIDGYGITGSPVLADMNDDGQLECAISSNAYWVYNTDIYVWNLGVPCVNAHLPWPMYRHDPHLTAAYVPTPSGITAGPRAAAGPRRTATVVRGVLVLPRDMTDFRPGKSGRVPRPMLLDACGRKVMALVPGPNDVSGLGPGVYFVQSGSTRTKLVVAR